MTKSLHQKFGPRVMFGVIALVVLAAIFWTLRTPPLEVDAARVLEAPLTVTINDEGETRVRDMFVVAAPINGRLLRVDLDAGDPVIAGSTIVAKIMPSQPDFLNPRSDAETRAQIQALQANVRSSASRITQADADRKLAAANFERIDALFQRGFATRTAHDAARAARDASAARLAEARGAKDAAHSELQAARARLIGPSGTGSGKILEIRAPESGSVLRLIHESETPIAAGTPIVEIGNPVAIEIVTDLLSRDAVRIKPGSNVLIDNWGGEQPLAGKVLRIEPFGFTKISALGVEEQRVNVILEFTDPEKARERLGHGYRVIVRIIEWSDDKVLQVPISALFRDKGQWSVFVVRNSEANLVRVKVGRMNDEHAQILEGLEADQSVILHPSEKIENETAVKLRQS